MPGINEDVTREVEQFLYREARLLDERRFHEWLQLLTDDELHAVQAHIAQELRMRPRATASGRYARVAQREGSPCATA